jgi:fructoselysine-6-P-deglycase FrlB-like protein
MSPAAVKALTTDWIGLPIVWLELPANNSATGLGVPSFETINDPESPLARAAQWVFPLHAGDELSVAATKSYIAQLVAGARVVAEGVAAVSIDRSDEPLHLAAEMVLHQGEQPILRDFVER